jgi:release factor glutamine methyltransferase
MSIYQPAEDSYMLQKYVKKLAFGRVLDIGTGSGIQAKTAAESINIKNVIAVDVQEDVVKSFNEELKQNKTNILRAKKLKVKRSDLFSNVENKFDTIIFNPPYLPQDYISKKPIDDITIYGGKKGWEVLERFFSELGNYLSSNGVALILFSSLTNKEKVDQFVEKNMFESELLEEKRLPMFETLYVYAVRNSKLRNKLTNLGVKNINYIAKGHRGLVYKAVWERSNLVKTHFAKKEELVVAIKTANPRSEAKERIANEAKWLNEINKLGMGPKLLCSTGDFLIMEFIEGLTLPKFIEKEKKLNSSKRKSKNLLNVILRILEQCYLLDKKGVNKEELNRPTKNLVISKNGVHNIVTLLDFERCYDTDKPHNVNQFCSFLAQQRFVDKENMLELAKVYKKRYSKADFEKILMLVKAGFS